MNSEKLPILKPVELVRALEKMGFLRTKKSAGGHLRYCHLDGRKTTVPMHKGRDISRGLLRKILQDINVSIEKFKEYL